MSLLKKILIVAGPIVLIVALYLAMRGGPDLPDSLTLVDIRTGKIERFKYGSVPSLPWKSPRDGERVMLPAYQDDEGTWLVSPRYHEVITAYYKEHGDLGAVDVERGGVIVAPESP